MKSVGPPARSLVQPNDLIIITADYGNDPTFTGTDHTREEVSFLVLDGQTSATSSLVERSQM